MLQAEQGTVGRKPTAQKPALVDAADANGFGRAIHLCRGPTLERHEDGETLTVADSRRDDPRCLSEALAPAVGNACQERLAWPSRERLHEPAAGLIAGLVIEPQDSLAVECRHPVDHADDAVGPPAAFIARRLPGVQLPDARRRGGVNAPVG